MSKDKILEVNNLCTSFFTDEGEIQAVRQASFSIHRGETLGIVGESGSGKSATALSLMRLLPAPVGKVVGGEARRQGLDADPTRLRVPTRVDAAAVQAFQQIAHCNG